MQLESSLRDTLAIFLLSRDIGPTFRFCSNGKFHIHRLKLNWNSIISLARYLSFSPFCSPFPNSTHLDLFLMRTYVSTKVGSFFMTALFVTAFRTPFLRLKKFSRTFACYLPKAPWQNRHIRVLLFSQRIRLLSRRFFSIVSFFFSFLFILAKWNLGCPRATLLTNRGKSLIKRTLHWNR